MVGPIKNDTPRAHASSISITRIHSRYCEARGPIVKEGFVAARVRALHCLENRNVGPKAASHSPMRPCPGPEATRVIKRLIPQSPMVVRRNSVPFDRLPSSALGSGQLLEKDSRSNLHPDHTSLTMPVEGNSMDTTYDPVTAPYMKAPNSRTEIFSPRAVPAQMARPNAPWGLSGQREEAASELIHA